MDFLPTWAVLGFFRKTELIEYRWIADRDRDRAEREGEIYSRNWLKWLWRPRSPTICRLQDGKPGKR